ncbi:MAG: hypothetical protein J6K55_11930 [Clostridia bacterium]|nr:hypothetical protein [Clostridia bacterium]
MSHILSIGCPLISLWALNEYLLWPREWSHSVLLIAVLFALAWLGRLFWTRKDGRLKRYALVFGFMFVLAQVCGARLDAAGTIAEAGATVRSLGLMLLSSLGLTPAAGGLFVWLTDWLTKFENRSAQKQRLTDKQLFYLAFALILLCWLPALLAYWPGIYSYDVERQIDQTVSGVFNDHNPIFHTLIIGGFHALGGLMGSYNLGISLYCIFQMIMTALTMALILRYLHHIRCPRWFVLAVLAVFCFAPFHQLLAISTTKDVLFTDALAAWAVLMIWGIREEEVTRKRSWKAGWILLAALGALMRTNGVLAIAAVLIGGWILLRKNRVLCRRILCLTLCAFVLYGAVHGGLVSLLDAQSGPFHEVLSVPIQQIARVNHLLKYESREEIRSWLPDVALYQPALTDYVKHTADIQPNDLPEFLGLWLRLGIKFPVIYLDAFGFLTKGYWHLDDLSHATFRGELLEYHEGYLGTVFRTSHGVSQNSLWPALYDWYERMYSINEYLQVPVLSALNGTALWCWLLTAVWFAAMYLRRKDVILPLTMCWAMYVFLFLGPCCIVRYVYPFMFIVPLCLGALLSPLRCTENGDMIADK